MVNACIVLSKYFFYEPIIEQASRTCSFTKHPLLYHRPEPSSEPVTDRHRETHLAAAQDLRWQHVPHGPAQNVLRVPAVANFHPTRQPRSELDQIMIQKWDAAFDRRRHAHLILLH